MSPCSPTPPAGTGRRYPSRRISGHKGRFHFPKQELLSLAEKKGLAVHENYMFLYHSQLKKVKELIANGTLGELRLIRAAFGFPMRGKDDFRYQKAMGARPIYSNFSSCFKAGIKRRNAISEGHNTPIRILLILLYLQHNEVDAIYLPLPPALHYKWGKKVLENGKHLLMEKPFTTSLAETQELLSLAEKKGLAVHENYIYRRGPPRIRPAGPGGFG